MVVVVGVAVGVGVVVGMRWLFLALAVAGCAPARVICLADSFKGLEAARNAGCRSLLAYVQHDGHLGFFLECPTSSKPGYFYH